MKLNLIADGQVYKKVSRDYTKKDGTMGTSYSLIIDLGEQVETFNVSQELFDKVEPMQCYNFIFAYSFPMSQYQREPIYISDVAPAISDDDID